MNKKEDKLPSITVYEFNENQIIKKLEYFSTYPADFSILINNNYCDKNKNEIDRFIRYNSDDNKIYFVSIFKKAENEEILKKLNENLEKENNDLKIKLQEKEEENNSLKNNNIENNKIIEGQKIEINTYKQEQNELKEEISNLKSELDEVKYI